MLNDCPEYHLTNIEHASAVLAGTTVYLEVTPANAEAVIAEAFAYLALMISKGSNQ